MKCHNERVARSRRHMAKQKQRERERERAALGSSSGRSVGSTNSRHREDESANGVRYLLIRTLYYFAQIPIFFRPHTNKRVTRQAREGGAMHLVVRLMMTIRAARDP